MRIATYYSLLHKLGKHSSIMLFTGARGGLRLRLNIEQYEYMPGPNSGAGLKILVHHQHEVPQLRDLGISIPPGSHSVVGVTTIKVSYKGTNTTCGNPHSS